MHRRGRRVVITGLGVATPLGIGMEAYWDALLEGRCGIGPVSQFDASGLSATIGGALPDFSLGDYISKGYRKSAKVMSRDIVVAVVSAYHAVVDAGLKSKCRIERGEVAGPPNVDSTRFGANIGAGLVCADLPELAAALSSSVDDDGAFSLTRWGQEGMSNLTPLWLLKFLPNMLACHVTIVHDAQAPSNTITCGESSSHLAIGEAFRTIARGDADVCICGGAESKMNPMAMARQLLLGRLNTSDNHAPQRACRPFAADRAGTVIAEGGGLVILEALDHARQRNARIYAEISGFGSACNTESWTQADPQGRAIERALRQALADADTMPEHMDLLVPQGMGTKAEDDAETAAWRAVFGPRLSEIPAFTPRGAIGHCGAGAGAIDFSAMVMALSRNTIPISLNTPSVADGGAFRFVHGTPRDARVQQAVTSGTALAGGQSAALVIRKFD